MKKITFLVSAFITAFTSFSQVIPNAGFETWINDIESGHSYLIPQHWTTSDEMASAFTSGYVGTAVTKTTSSYAGSSAVLMQTCINAGDTISGAIYSCDSLAQLLNTLFGANKALGFPFAQRPAVLSGYYKFTTVGGDSAAIDLIMTKWNTVTHMRDTVVYGYLAKGANVSTYTQFNMNISYMLNVYPDTAFIVAGIQNAVGNTHVGTMFYLDALAFSGTVPVGIKELPVDNKFVSVFPNPFTNKATVQVDAKIQMNKASFKIYDVLGNEVRNIQNFSSNVFTIEKDDLQSGIYFYTLTNNGAIIANGKFIAE